MQGARATAPHQDCDAEEHADAGLGPCAPIGDAAAAKQAAEYWRFGPKAFKNLYNVRDPDQIEVHLSKHVGQRMEGELAVA